MKPLLLILFFISLGLGGCVWSDSTSLPQKRILASDVGKQHKIHSGPAELRHTFTSVTGTYTKKVGDVTVVRKVVRFCTEPFPDVGGTSDSKLQLQLAANLQQMAQVSQNLTAENERLRKRLQESEIRREAVEDAARISARSTNNESNDRSSLGSSTSASTSTGGSGSLDFAMSRALGIVELKGRSEDVLLARDLLYRICEAAMSDPSNYDAKQVVKMQTQAIEFLRQTRKNQNKALIAKSQATVVEKGNSLFAEGEKQCKSVRDTSEASAKLTEQVCAATSKPPEKEPARKARCALEKIPTIQAAKNKYIECSVANKTAVREMLAKAVPAAGTQNPDVQLVKLSIERMKACDTTKAVELNAAGTDTAKIAQAKTNHEKCVKDNTDQMKAMRAIFN